MAKAFSVLSWNIKHFKDKDPPRLERVAEVLSELKPDVMGIYEVTGKNVWNELMEALPGYSFFITEGQNTQHILVGIKRNVTAFLTQKIEFKSRDAFMRPGAFLTVRVDDEDYALLFLHVASMPEARGFGLRADMIERAFEFKGVLDKASTNGGRANFIFLGDLNSMGLDYKFGRDATNGNHFLRDRVAAEDELKRLAWLAGSNKMRVLTKSAPFTWRNKGGRKSNLDHVVASDQLQFRSFGGNDVSVRGWPEKATSDEQRQWVVDYSDHALLYFEVQKV